MPLVLLGVAQTRGAHHGDEVVELGAAFKKIGDFEERFPAGVPSLKEATHLRVEGDWTFGREVVVVGDGRLGDEGGTVADGSRIG